MAPQSLYASSKLYCDPKLATDILCVLGRVSTFAGCRTSRKRIKHCSSFFLFIWFATGVATGKDASYEGGESTQILYPSSTNIPSFKFSLLVGTPETYEGPSKASPEFGGE
jgi:hypothetical protein